MFHTLTSASSKLWQSQLYEIEAFLRFQYSRNVTAERTHHSNYWNTQLLYTSKKNKNRTHNTGKSRKIYSMHG